ncbi:MAG: MFS transporter [Alphaproteobacteria bacterium]|nr:MFS transporter [Alphaproteobacteria bacterium]
MADAQRSHEVQVVQVSHLIDERGLSSINIMLIVWSLFIVFIDGYDISAISFAAPPIAKAWHIANRGAFGPVFSASLVGILVGSGLFGYIGDRHGRKKALIGSLVTFGVFTWIAAYSTSLSQIFWLRLVAGIGIGGVIPNVVAMNIEFAPRHLRSTLAIIAVGLVPVGGAIPGVVTATLVPQHGWPIIFLIGGIAPLVIAAVALFALPESIKYMAIHEGHRQDMERLIAVIRPDIKVAPNARFVVEDEKQYPGFNPKYLFRDGLHLITPLLWLLFALNLMGYFFLLSWTPLLLTASKLPLQVAAAAGTALQVGGTVGAFAICRSVDKYGFRPIALLFVLAVPVVGSIGFIGLGGSVPALVVVSFFAGFCVLGVQSAINVAGAMVYPTSLRANGSGWELGLGRIGSIVGPLVGGVFVMLPIQQLYMWSALPFVVGAVICYIISRLNEARLEGRLGQPAVQ